MTIHDRIKLVVKWLIGSGVANNQEAVGRLMGYKNKSSFSQILNNKVPIPEGFINKLSALHININKVWIEEGHGSMIKEVVSAEVYPESSVRMIYEIYKDQIQCIRDKDEKIENLKEQIGELKERIRQLESEKFPEKDAYHVSTNKSSTQRTQTVASVDALSNKKQNKKHL